MMLTVTVPDCCRAECAWITHVLLEGFLGVSYVLKVDTQIRNMRMEADGRVLSLPADFFGRASAGWLTADTMPAFPLWRWMPAEDDLHPVLVAPTVPVLYGKPGFVLAADGNATLYVDIFGSAFFMLSRYEEAVVKKRDCHGRFPASASVAGKAGFIERPIIDEYVEILWQAMLRLWPGMKRKPRQFTMTVTCDVDHPYHPGARSFLRMLKRTAGELARRRGLRPVCAPVRNYFACRQGNWRHDPYHHTVDWMMDINERAGNRIGFYFIPEITDPVMDDTCPITDTAVAAMMGRIIARGHEIGIHPGYHSYRSRERLASGLRHLRYALARSGISQPVTGGRQHYLRWSVDTPALWNEVGLHYDSTLGYADHAGFRCGTCHDYPMYDLQGRRALAVRQRPLICMDCSVIAYMGYGWTEAALDYMQRLKAITRRFEGSFTLLWHNSYFDGAPARTMYQELVCP